MGLSDIGVAFFALGRNVLYLIIGIAVLIAVVDVIFRYMNASLGINFHDHAWEAIKGDAKAVALYFGLRILGVIIAGGLIASAFLK